MPLEGGLYQWAKLGFNELTGFLVAWNLWLFAILNTSEIGLQITQYVAYIARARAATRWLTGSRWFVDADERRDDRRRWWSSPCSGWASASGCTRPAAC